MDRLPAVSAASTAAWSVAVLAAGGLLPACDDPPASPPAAARRVVAVAAERPAADLEAFCDARPEGTLEAALATVPGAADALPDGRPVWLNVWATWCEPCKEELPLVLSLRERLVDGQAARHALAFLSVDADDATVATWRATHPEMPDSLRVAPGDGLDAVLAGLGLPTGSSIPIHAFAGDDGRLRCVRRGQVERHHVGTLAALLGD